MSISKPAMALPFEATQGMIKAALDLVWEESETHEDLVCRLWRAMAAVAPDQPPAARELALEEAARNLIANRFDSYKARNGKLCSIEGDDGEKCWIVSFDHMAELESSLWAERVEKGEAWVRSLGFTPYRTSSIGFRQLARDKKGFPTQKFQWCSFILKIEPGQRWLAENDPDCRAVCLVGVRRDESQDRADFPEWLIKSMNHGGRMMVAPFATFSEVERNALIYRAGWEVLPHRSRECRCINSNRNDMKRFTEADWQAIAEIEQELGKTMFRPKRHMGAVGADEVRKWANSPRGKYQPPEPMPDALELEDAPDEEDMFGNSGKCDTFGGCGR